MGDYDSLPDLLKQQTVTSGGNSKRWVYTPSIRRTRQPYYAITQALEQICEWLDHPGACALLNRYGGAWSVPYQWAARRSIAWYPSVTHER